MDEALLRSLTEAVRAAPSDVALRLHLATLLIDAHRSDEAVAHLAAVLTLEPSSESARALMARALGVTDTERTQHGGGDPGIADADGSEARSRQETDEATLARLDLEIADLAPPMFVTYAPDRSSSTAFDAERSEVLLADVGGMEDVKRRLDAAFLAPLRNPELRNLYGKSLRGGLLMYGPPGCGKTYLARAVAGELDVALLAVSLADILDMFIGNSEKNVQELFATARATAPCVLFLDELDAIGQKRSLTGYSGLRTTVNQLLMELDGVGDRNEGVFVLAATNHPWDVDPALRRPGRIDRMLLVGPPDDEARQVIFRTQLRDRPVAAIDVARLARRTEGYSGADIAHICEGAAERALLDSVHTGRVRMIDMSDLEAAIGEVRPSIGPWLQMARNVAVYGNESGDYDELAELIRKRKIR